MVLFVISAFVSTFSMPSYIVQILKAYNVPMQPDQAAALISYVNNLGNIAFLCLIRFTGKRYLYLTMMTVLFLSAATLCGYGQIMFIFLKNVLLKHNNFIVFIISFWVLPAGYTSYPDLTPNFPLENKTLGYIPFAAIIITNFTMFCGINAMPW